MPTTHSTPRMQAAYGKLRRTPISISEVFLNYATRRLRAFTIQDQNRAVSSISTEKYFQDVRDDLIACARLIGVYRRLGKVVVIDKFVVIRELLRILLHDQWKSRWQKAKTNRHRKKEARPG